MMIKSGGEQPGREIEMNWSITKPEEKAELWSKLCNPDEEAELFLTMDDLEEMNDKFVILLIDFNKEEFRGAKLTSPEEGDVPQIKFIKKDGNVVEIPLTINKHTLLKFLVPTE